MRPSSPEIRPRSPAPRLRLAVPYALLAGLLLGLSGPAAAAQERPAGQAWLFEVKGPIGPAVSDYLVRGIERAEAAGAEVVVLRMDTPGGLDSSMRQIIQKIVTASVPVATWVAPSGSRAASAGTYILYASHVAAMAPATNLGAATPVQIGPGGGLPGGGGEPSAPADGGAQGGEAGGGDGGGAVAADPMKHKIVNDAVAYIRGLAKMRGRNVEWAEKAVREAASLTAADALEKNVVDVIAPDLDSLLAQMDGREIELPGGARTLHTAGLAVHEVEPDWRTRLLAIITDPNVAYILMLLGVYGLFFELSSPGTVLPGVLGAISLLLALYAFQVLPVNYAGLALIILGLAFMIAEAFVPSFGALGIGGAVAFIVGSLILMETDAEGFTLSLPLVIVVAAVSVGFILTIGAMALRQRRQPLVSGESRIIGSVGVAADSFGDRGGVHLGGELWNARTQRPVREGQKVRVLAREGLTLEIEPLEGEES